MLIIDIYVFTSRIPASFLSVIMWMQHKARVDIPLIKHLRRPRVGTVPPLTDCIGAGQEFPSLSQDTLREHPEAAWDVTRRRRHGFRLNLPTQKRKIYWRFCSFHYAGETLIPTPSHLSPRLSQPSARFLQCHESKPVEEESEQRPQQQGRGTSSSHSPPLTTACLDPLPVPQPLRPFSRSLVQISRGDYGITIKNLHIISLFIVPFLALLHSFLPFPFLYLTPLPPMNS